MRQGRFWELISKVSALAMGTAVGSTRLIGADSEGGMKLVQWTAYGCFGVAGLAVILAMSNEAPAFLSVTLAATVLGIAFLAAHQGLVLLADIRNALVPQTSAPERTPGMTVEPTAVRTASAIAADIAELKARG